MGISLQNTSKTQFSMLQILSESSIYIKKSAELKSNPEQWAAYESRGHCIVLAGPGSGKTKTLTLKLAKLLSEEIENPRGVACITYNTECARELETRLLALGIAADKRVFIGTVHSFSLTQIIMPYAKVAGLGLPDNFSVATKSQRQFALENAYNEVFDDGGNPNKWESPMNDYRKFFLDRTDKLWSTQDPQLAHLVEVYERELRTLGCIDFDDMPLLAVKALRENKWIQSALFAKFPVLAVDEYQDLGGALHRMVMGLCFTAGIRLFAVGDADQSIYGFTGAKPDLLRRLSERGDVECVSLRTNYRSANRIVEASAWALGEKRDYHAVDDAEDGTVYFHPLAGRIEDQATFVFDTLLPEILSRNLNASLGDVAILYSAAWVGDIIDTEAKKNELATVRTDSNALYPRGNKLIRWIELCAQWCCGGWQTGDPRFTRIAHDARVMFFEILGDDDTFLNFQRSLFRVLWNTRNSDQKLLPWLITLQEQLLEDLLQNAISVTDEWDEFLDFTLRLEDDRSLADFLLEQFAGQGHGNNALHLSTLHSSKGREFQNVILFGVDEGAIPRKNASTKSILESRRLFYVGFTRAELEIHMVYSKHKPSRFVVELYNRINN